MNWPALDAGQWALAALAAFCVGVAKSGFGGVGMIAVLLMALVLPPRESTGAILPMLILADLFAVTIYRRHAQGHLVIRLLPPAIAGIVCGWLIIPAIRPGAFGPLIGWITLALLLLVFLQKVRPGIVSPATAHPGVAWPFGWLAGVTTMIANAAGPVMSIYLLACRLPKLEFVGTAAWFFFAVNLIKVPFSASLGLINFSSLQLNAFVAPAVIAGLFLGRWLLGKVNQSVFEWLMIAFTLVGALKLVIA